MTIRLAQDSDIQSIIELFKMSLGEAGGIPEASFWKWKHYQNPFGESPTLLAFDDNKLIGLRTFLLWRFRYEGKIICAYRAVDTATHPDYRGKGVFRNLTLELVNKLKQGQPSFIFNTPNKQSISGYLKMGWKELGRTPLYVKPLPYYWILNKIRCTQDVPSTLWSSELERAWLDIEEPYKKLTSGFITTDYSIDYLKWRYRDIPGFTYYYHSTIRQTNQVLIFYRIKKSKRLKELRITDIFFDKLQHREVKEAINEISLLHKPDLITILADTQDLLKPLALGFLPAKQLGLKITFREVNDPELTVLVSQPKRWFLSSGTIELF